MNHPLLRLTQISFGKDRHQVEVSLELPGQPRQTATSSFTFALTDQDQRDLRWYLEDYLQYPQDPAPTVAARIEQRMADIGRQLFEGVFQPRDAFKLWSRFQAQLAEARVEIATTVSEATAIPWELLRDPDTDTPLALRARAFVRTHTEPAQPALSPRATTGPVRILLVICRPRAGDDVPFRSVASRIVKGLNEEARATFQLDVLRPPTFEQLSRTLRQVKAAGQPYHVVHFDGHGLYLEDSQKSPLSEVLKQLSALLLNGPREGSHGYLAFENPAVEENMQLVDGPALGKLLVETGVPLLVLNACRSAHAEAAPAPEEAGSADIHAEVRAYGTLAQEVMDQGATGVVSMRYNVYVVTAAQFVAYLYAALARGQSLGEAVSLGRKQLAAQPLREIAYDARPLQDWSVPVVYEAAPLALFPPSGEKKLTITLRAAAAAPQRGEEIDLPAPPDAGFWGRDETLLALDRAFDTQHVVLLHAFAGSGKTATVAEFGRWYALTGGIDGPVLFTSFDRYLPLSCVLDLIGRVFGPLLERQKKPIHWLALTDAQRRDIALQVLTKVPVLWIWDNVEQVAGFPTSSPSAWKPEEQQELLDFLRAASGIKTRFLLTSRRDERPWLGDLPARLTLPPMPMQERVQLARALAAKHGKTLTAVDDWRPLLKFTGGNPLTLMIVVGQAMQEDLKTRKQIEAFVQRLRAGEAAFQDEASEGRSKSLGASLSYGFENAFNEDECRQLALLHLFQGFVNVGVLTGMGDPINDDFLPELCGLTHDTGTALMDRAVQAGLLTSHGSGYYTIHPALPWYFKQLFEIYYSSTTYLKSQPCDGKLTIRHPQSRAIRAFVFAMSSLGGFYAKEYGRGNRDVVPMLKAEEANLLHARQLALANAWWPAVVGTMSGLNDLYDHTGRRSEWSHLVNEILPDFIDPATDGPLPGREEAYGVINQFRVRLARERHQWAQAERLQRLDLDLDRRGAAAALSAPPGTLDDAQRAAIRSLAVSLEEIGDIQREQHKPECAQAYNEAIDLFHRIGDLPAEAASAFNLGRVYQGIPALRDFSQAEHWYRQSLEIYFERDALKRAAAVGQLAILAYERFKEAQSERKPQAELLDHLNASMELCQEALRFTPSDDIDSLAVRHNTLGVIYGEARQYDNALEHYRKAIQYWEAEGEIHNAAVARRNVAIVLAESGSLASAREYALTALCGFQTYGDRSAEEIHETRGLIAQIEEASTKQQRGVKP